MKRNLFNVKLLALLSFVAVSCDEEVQEPTDETKFGTFTVIDENTIEMDGEINSNTLTNFNTLIASYAGINKINMKEVLGSSDDDINLQVSALVNNKGITTYIMDNGAVASGGTDFFLAGTTRSKGEDTKIGVHSWTDGTNEARDFPVGNTEHQKYIDYYVSIGFTQTDAEDFYYYTINAAPASEMHYMTEAEIQEYKILVR